MVAVVRVVNGRAADRLFQGRTKVNESVDVGLVFRSLFIAHIV